MSASIYIPQPQHKTNITNLLQVRPEKYQQIQDLKNQVKNYLADADTHEKDELLNALGDLRKQIFQEKANI